MEDLRVRKTKKKLLEAMFELMQSLPFDKITVSDICEKANVHRATFYNHYRDKNDLLNYGLDELQECMFNAVVKDGTKENRDMYLELVSNIYDFFAQNRKEFSLIVKNGSEKLHRLCLETTQRSIRYLIGKHRDGREYAMPMDIMVNFLAGGFAAVAISQVASDKPSSKAEVMKFFEVLLNDKLFIKNGGEK